MGKQKTDQTRFPRTKRSRSRRIFESFSTNSLSISRSQISLFRERGNKIKGEEECVIKGEEECVTQRTSEDGDAGNYATAAPTTPTTKWDDDNSCENGRSGCSNKIIHAKPRQPDDDEQQQQQHKQRQE